jgi:radical SAM-linked protein
VQRLWLRISRTDQARYLSHLEAMNAWLRALRRAKTPLAYSQGFHPHPKFAFSSAMPMNTQSVGEYLDLTLVGRVDPADYLQRLAAVLPPGFGAHAITEVPLNAPALMAINDGGDWTMFFPDLDEAEVAERLEALLAADEVNVERRQKSKRKRGRRHGAPQTKTVNLRPSIVEASMREGSVVPAIDLRVVKVDGVVAKPRELVSWFTDRADRVKLLRRDTLVATERGHESMSAGWGEAAELPAAQVVHTPTNP